MLGPDQRLEGGPLRLDLLLERVLLALGDLLELGVDPRLLSIGQVEPGEAALVVDRDRRAVIDRAGDVVDVDVVAEDRRRVAVRQLDRGAGEADEGRPRQGIAQVAGEAVDEVVLAAVRLIGDDHHIASVGQQRESASALVGQELLNGGEDHAAGGNRQQALEVGARLGLHRILAQELGAAGEGPEQLIVEVVAVGEHHDGRVLEGGLEDQLAGEEGHRQALARSLRVPHHPSPLVAVGSAGGDRRLDRPIDGVVLVVAGQLLGGSAGLVVEHDEVAQVPQQAFGRQEAADEDLELG